MMMLQQARYTLFAVAASIAAGSVPSVLAAPPEVTFENGIGRNPGGPGLSDYSINEGQYLPAGTGNWWQQLYMVDGFSRLDEILPASRSARPELARPWRRAPQEPRIEYEGAPV